MVLNPPTDDEVMDALDVLIRMALTDKGMTTGVIDMLATLPQDGAGQRVATIFCMLGGGAVQDPKEWIAILQSHIAGAEPPDDEEG